MLTLPGVVANCAVATISNSSLSWPVVTVPSVAYQVTLKNNKKITIKSPQELPNPETIEKVFEDATISRPIKKSAEKIEVHTELLPPITPRGDSVKLLKKLIEEMKS